MHKVVVERPRRNPGPTKKGRRANLPDELLPKFEGIKRPYSHRKWQTDLLGPLRRWLQSQVGRPWNDVYSEACAVIKPDSVIRAHIKTHLLEFIERHTFMHDGQVCMLDTSRSGGPVPVTERPWGRNSCRFYVHPETGLLQVILQMPRRLWPEPEPKPVVTVHWIRKNVARQQIRGLWFECYYEIVPYWEWFDPYDHALERNVTLKEVRRYQHYYYLCTRKRQLSKKELRRLGLRNAPTPAPIGAQSSADFISDRLNMVLQLCLGLPRYQACVTVPANEPHHTFLYGLGCSQRSAFPGQA